MMLYSSLAVLLLTVLAVSSHIVVSPIQLQPATPSPHIRSTQRRLIPGDQQLTFLSTPPPSAFVQKQDNVFLSPSYSSPATQASILDAVRENQAQAAEAILAGKGVSQVVDAVENVVDAILAKRGENVDSGKKLRWDLGKDKVRGVNLGGWLVIEPWITPSLFEATGNDAIVDEWTFGEHLGYKEAYARLFKHWSKFITEDDIATIASYGLNHVRIPVGYWAFDISDGEPYVQGQYAFLLTAIQWCNKHNLRVIVDIHGGPGSQNGFDNSGRRGNATWHTDERNVNRTLAIVRRLATEFAKPEYDNTVTQIQLLNEPAGFLDKEITRVYKQFAYNGYGAVRYPKHDDASMLILSLHDAFQPLESWQDVMPDPDFYGVSLDTHIYTVFSQQNNELTYDERIKSICSMKDYLAKSNANLPTIVGEWSAASTDCARWLNGRGLGARYDGSFPSSTRVGSCIGKSGSSSTFSKSYKTFLRKFWEVQTSVYEESGSGWVWWTWKAENADEWSWKAGVEGGWIPEDAEEKMYGDQCA